MYEKKDGEMEISAVSYIFPDQQDGVLSALDSTREGRFGQSRGGRSGGFSDGEE